MSFYSVFTSWESYVLLSMFHVFVVVVVVVLNVKRTVFCFPGSVLNVRKAMSHFPHFVLDIRRVKPYSVYSFCISESYVFSKFYFTCPVFLSFLMLGRNVPFSVTVLV